MKLYLICSLFFVPFACLTAGNLQSPSRDEICSLKAEPGVPGTNIMCMAYFPKYYFNSAVGYCEKFIFGGCGGNANSFSTKEECEKFCGSGDKR